MFAFAQSTPLVSLRTSAVRRCGRISPRMHLSLPELTTAANPAALQKVADAFNSLGLPKPVTEWGHPALMGFMILGMGVPGALIGWSGRIDENKKEGVKKKQLHENIMLAFFLLACLGGTGGILATAMAGYDIFESVHAKSAAAVLFLLGANTVIAYSGFSIGNDGSPKGRLAGRKLHAYFGSATMFALFVHAFLGLRILLN